MVANGTAKTNIVFVIIVLLWIEMVREILIIFFVNNDKTKCTQSALYISPPDCMVDRKHMLCRVA